MMNDPRPSEAVDDELDQVLSEYLALVDAGRKQDARKLFSENSRFALKLERYLSAAAILDEAAGELGMTPRSGSQSTDVPTEPATVDYSPTFQLAGFEIKGELGRGGMGVVYRAMQLSVGREVALKVLPPALASDPVRLRRFRNEATVAAGIKGSHILPLYDVIESNGVPVLVMQLVDGSDLARIIHDRKAHNAGRRQGTPRHAWSALRPREYLDCVLSVLDKLINAVALVHEADVLHRDIKPSNVLVDTNGNVWLSDFGLARLGQQSGSTLPGAAVGTAGYMSPEQAGGAHDLDGRSDVFGLGATIYHALTLARPFDAVNDKASDGLLVPPSRLAPALGTDFDLVIRKALEPDRRHRYASVVDLQADWNRVRSGLPPLGCNVGKARRAMHWMRRNRRPALAAAMAAAIVAAVGFVISSGPRPLPDVISSGPRPLPEVQVQTIPAAQRGVMVPMSSVDGELAHQDARHAVANEAGDLVFSKVPPGDYLVVVAAANGDFHEVQRRVPAPDEKPGEFPHLRWSWPSKGLCSLDPIAIPPASVSLDMVYQEVEPSPFVVGSVELSTGNFTGFAPPHQRIIADFYLDRTEVTLGEYRKRAPLPPLGSGNRRPKENEAMNFVNYDEAVAYAEKVGKRLPNEAEFEFAATNGGRSRFPWGDDAASVRDPLWWSCGPVGTPLGDRTMHEPPLAGMYSNVVEWTTSWFYPYPSAPRDAARALPPRYYLDRILRGGGRSVIIGLPDATENSLGPRYRHGEVRTARHPALGFRCARSAEPPFLPPRKENRRGIESK